MIVNRVINNISIAVETTEGNSIYFSEYDAEAIKTGGNSIEYILRYLYGESEKYIPMFLTLELTSKCNYRCPFCFINTKDARENQLQQTIRFKDIKSDLEWLIDRGLLYCTITGGEPLVHPDFKEIYSFLKDSGVVVTVFTNLSCVDDQLMELFIQKPPFRIETTMYGFNNSTYAEATGQGTFTAEDFKNRVLHMRKKGINVICKTPLNTLTYPDFHQMKEWCETNGVYYYYSEQVFSTYDGESMNCYKLDDHINEEIIIDRVSDDKTENISKFGYKKAFDCGAAKYGFFISHSYALRPCMSFYVIDEASFPIAETGIDLAFQKLESFIQEHKTGNLSDCKGCNAFPFCKVCVIDEIKKNKHISSGYANKCTSYSKIHDFIMSNREN